MHGLMREGRGYPALYSTPYHTAKSFGTASYESKEAPSMDLEGNARPQGTGYDAGAYEFVEAPLPPAAPSGLSVW
jgi:hypothetical protein